MFYTYGTQLMIEQELREARDMAQTYNLISMARMSEKEEPNRLLSAIFSLTRSAVGKFEELRSSQSIDQVEYKSTC
jgi:hypothetical protein